MHQGHQSTKQSLVKAQNKIERSKEEDDTIGKKIIKLRKHRKMVGMVIDQWDCKSSKKKKWKKMVIKKDQLISMSYCQSNSESIKNNVKLKIVCTT